MADLDALIATVQAGDSPDARAAVRALAEIDDDRARHALAGALAGAGPLTALAIGALARHGAKAQTFALAATLDPDRRLGGVAVLGKLGDPSSQRTLREWAGDPDPMMRLTVAASLYRCDERDPKVWSDWIRRENDLAVFAFLAAIAGAPGVTLTYGTLDHLEAQARETSTPLEVRAGATWAVAQHDAARGTALAQALLAEGGASPAVLASIVRRRGGALVALCADIEGADPAADKIADNLGLPRG
jgi:HEAT repeat protein